MQHLSDSIEQRSFKKPHNKRPQKPKTFKNLLGGALKNMGF